MKNLILLLNIFLALGAAGMIFYNIQDQKGDETEYSVKKSGKKTVEKKPVSYAVVTPESEWKNKIIDQNLFDQSRNPNAQSGSSSGNIQLTLVGVCEVGGVKGAIIVQKTSARRNFRFGPPGFQQDTAQNNQPKSSPQQYIRVGETLSNGYTLTEITRTGAVLVRNGSRMELELQKASVAATPANAGNRRTTRQNPMQQMQQMQMFQNMQMMRMMRMMQQNNQNNSGGNRGGTTTRRMNGNMGAGNRIR